MYKSVRTFLHLVGVGDAMSVNTRPEITGAEVLYLIVLPLHSSAAKKK